MKSRIMRRYFYKGLILSGVIGLIVALFIENWKIAVVSGGAIAISAIGLLLISEEESDELLMKL